MTQNTRKMPKLFSGSNLKCQVLDNDFLLLLYTEQAITQPTTRSIEIEPLSSRIF
jgi:hypothetical protein